MIDQNGGDVTFVDDGDGDRVSKTIGGVTTEYLVDDRNHTGYAQVVEEIVNGTVGRIYPHSLDLVKLIPAPGEIGLSEQRLGQVAVFAYMECLARPPNCYLLPRFFVALAPTTSHMAEEDAELQLRLLGLREPGSRRQSASMAGALQSFVQQCSKFIPDTIGCGPRRLLWRDLWCR